MRTLKQKVILSLFLLISLMIFPENAAGEIFEFKHTAGDRYRILSIVEEEVLVNRVVVLRAEILNRIAFEVTGITDGKARHKAVFQTSERPVKDGLSNTKNDNTGFVWSREYESVFDLDKLGQLTIEPHYFMPMVRNVPVFPGRDLKVGDKWYAPAYEVHDFRDTFEIEEPYKIPFNAFYEYVGEREWKNVSYPAFTVTYNIESRPEPVPGKIYPVRISGTYKQLVFWNRELGQTIACEEQFRVTFDVSDGRRIEFRGKAQAEFVDSDEMDKEKIVTEIKEELERQDIKNVEVKVVNDGISLSLEDIKFYPDSDRMLPGEEEKLERIADILKRYSNRDILVSGHAALAGSPDYLMELSEKRARAVGDYLLAENVRTPDRVVVRGFGALRPIADNSTEEGMRKNRRVEITILEN